LTDFPIAAYVLAAAFDVIATFGRDESWARDFWHAGTYVFVGGAAVSVLAALTGFWDWLRSTEPGTQARRTANAHALTMIVVTVLALTDIALRIDAYSSRNHPSAVILVLSLVIALLVSLGAALGGTLVFDYGFNVETAADSPVWHPSEEDVLPGGDAE
jgi:uncharacterized membrane protein